MRVRNTQECYGCTETIYEVASIEAFCDEVADNLFRVPACEKIQEMDEAGLYVDDDLQKEFETQYRNDFIAALEIIEY
jgi:hypothetical protein